VINDHGVLKEKVGTNVEYAGIHEYGKTFSRMVSEAYGRPMKNPHAVTFHYPERSFLRSSLHDLESSIREALRKAITRALVT
ncbi:MAG: phage virion morphogenesis protein, partial [Candidatus Saccharimonadales bacterium]